MASVRQTLVRVLQSLGLVDGRGPNGREALALLEEHGEVPLIVSDLYMPEMDGIDLPPGGASAAGPTWPSSC